MGIFGTSSPFDQDVERATSENNTSEEWGLILEICDRAGASATNSRDCLRAVMRRLAHPDPHVQVHAATLLDACISNCGKIFHLEVASREFEMEFRRLLSRAQPAVSQKLMSLLRKWAEGEFRNDPQLDLIPSLHNKLCSELGEKTSVPTTEAQQATKDAAAQREQEELARAIALSLREANTSTSASTALYPKVEATDAPAPTPTPARKVRALYDFEAAEDNELTFMAGEIVHVTDSSDPNWWKGYNERGEGLFPANFVTSDLTEPATEAETRPATSSGKTVQFATETPVRIDESSMDEALSLLHEADPTGETQDDVRLSELEARVYAMGPLVDTELERADRRHARLTQLSAELVDALNLYHELMRDPKPMYVPYVPVPLPHQMPHQMPHPHTLPHQLPHQPQPQPPQPQQPRC
ncbi:signal transducing adapter molecule 1 [Colias croceus]|uniref:signal transducing adapter molecule 1 n=1 Tax=Colias crocea TaxID=72248 RepID=UPI001E27A0B5|nr:signal transducing adapter molecule 1 [Colias croceus]XP_045511455.1 signal transducing adapter molecule 1 [Colias croceus]XP_045511456.1 signal transducing adapter molecule 1 [Colias croceus]